MYSDTIWKIFHKTGRYDNKTVDMAVDMAIKQTDVS